ncbi:Dabb family protein [soil metagenome]
MTVRHLVMFRWKPETTQDQIDALTADLAGMPDMVPSIVSYDFGPDVIGAEGNFDFAIVAGFDDETGYRAYATDEGHVAFAAERIRPLVSERAALQVGF